MYTGRDSPPPATYRLKTDIEMRKMKNTGYSFGLPYSVYKKVHMEGVATGAEDIPGPGNYDQKTTIGANSRKFSIKSKLKNLDATTRNYPGANYYNPEHNQTEQSRFDNIGFGVGGRGSVNGKILDTPGPGTYKLNSPFDKFGRVSPYTQSNFFQKRRKSKGRHKRSASQATKEEGSKTPVNIE